MPCRRVLRACALLASVLVLGSAPGSTARADGARIESRIDLGQLVQRSDVIFLGTVRRVAHQRQTTRAYGEDRVWIATYRLQIEVGEVLRGADRLEVKPGQRVWVHRGSDSRPGKWVLLRDFYDSGYGLPGAKAGDRVLVFGSNGTLQEGKPAYLQISEVERADRAEAAREAIAKAEAKVRAGWRDGSKCKAGKFLHDGRCRTPEQIVAGVACPEGAQAEAEEPAPGALRVQCSNAGTFEGPSLSWGRAGYPSAAGAMAAGQREGEWRFWDGQGRPQRTTHYLAGKRHGAEVRFHDNGQIACEGRWADDLQDGTWTCYTEAGAVAGRYEMQRGTGAVRGWRPDGTLQSEQEQVAGRAMGLNRLYDRDGKLELEGAYVDGRMHGLFRYLRPDGTVRLTLCYRRGDEVWRAEEPAEAAQRRCP